MKEIIKTIKTVILFVITALTSLIVAGFAYLYNYDGVLQKQNGLDGIIMLILFINIMGNLIQVIVEMQNLFQETSGENSLDKKLIQQFDMETKKALEEN